MDFSKLPGTIANKSSDYSRNKIKSQYTYTAYVDERILYEKLHYELLLLEKSNVLVEKDIDNIAAQALTFRLASEEKEEIEMRLNGLKVLYRAQEEIFTANSWETLSKIKNVLSTVQTSPMKNTLLEKVEVKLAKIQVDKNIHVLEGLNSKKAGLEFINLGEAGRSFILNRLFNELGEEIEIKDLQKAAVELEAKVNSLKKMQSEEDWIETLSNLPLPAFHTLDIEKKLKTVQWIKTNKNFNGLSSLNKLIATSEEESNTIPSGPIIENIITLDNGSAAITLNSNELKEIFS